MTNTLYNQTAPTAADRLVVKDQPREAAKKSIDRVGKALDKVFAEARERASA